jgi:arginine/ornithine N-succinyltransferase beta subunit
MATERSRHSDDVNAEVREAVDRDGYSLFRIGLSFAEIPKS